MIRVLIAEDEGLIRDALNRLLDYEDDIEVVTTMSRGDEALDWLLVHDADVAVLDIDMPGSDGIAVARRLAAASRTVAVIILSGKANPQDLRRALDVPVLGFATKGISGRALSEVIRTVVTGQRWIDPDLAALTISMVPSPLREREADVLRLIEGGYSTAEIAAKLFLTQGTVRNYVSSACTKLNARNKINAVQIARSRDWL